MGRLARVGDLRGAVRPLAPGDGGGGRKPLRRPAPPAGVACGAGLAAPVGGPGCRGLLPALRQALPGRRVRVHQHFAYAGLRGRHPGARDGGHRHRAVRPSSWGAGRWASTSSSTVRACTAWRTGSCATTRRPSPSRGTTRGASCCTGRPRRRSSSAWTRREWTSAGICASSLSALPAGASSMPASTGPGSAAGSSSVTCCIPASC